MPGVPMTGAQRVSAALSFREADRVPHFDYFWGNFDLRWRRSLGLPADPALEDNDMVDDPELDAYFGVDMYVAIADETPWYGRNAILSVQGDATIRRDGWGRTVRTRAGARFSEELSVALAEKAALDSLQFQPATDDGRYTDFLRNIAVRRGSASPPFIMCKVGGPYLRSSYLRGEVAWLMDMVEDPAFVDALAGRMTDHLIAIGLESLRRGNLYEHGIAIYDDIAGNRGLQMGPRLYRRFFLPQMARMIASFKSAGASKVMFHSDGDIRAVLPDLVDIGVDAINPVEPRANMDAVEIRRRFGDKLAIVGGLCNSVVLPSGSDHDVREHVLHVLRAGEGGGLAIGSHTIASDISLERYNYVMSLLRQYGQYPLRLPRSGG